MGTKHQHVGLPSVADDKAPVLGHINDFVCDLAVAHIAGNCKPLYPPSAISIDVLVNISKLALWAPGKPEFELSARSSDARV